MENGVQILKCEMPLRCLDNGRLISINVDQYILFRMQFNRSLETPCERGGRRGDKNGEGNKQDLKTGAGAGC
jgi:hypothetical protein